MNQCPYRIKDAKGLGWYVCQHEAGHLVDHKPPAGKRFFEGIWHRPGEKSTADPEPLIPCVPFCQESK